MTRYRSKPTIIEAIQWLGNNHADLDAFGARVSHPRYLPRMQSATFTWKLTLWVSKANTWIQLDVGTWIVKEPDGTGFYPCVDDIFQAKYSEVCEVCYPLDHDALHHKTITRLHQEEE